MVRNLFAVGFCCSCLVAVFLLVSSLFFSLFFFFFFFFSSFFFFFFFWGGGGGGCFLFCFVFSAEDGVGKTRPDQEAKVLLTHEEQPCDCAYGQTDDSQQHSGRVR